MGKRIFLKSARTKTETLQGWRCNSHQNKAVEHLVCINSNFKLRVTFGTRELTNQQSPNPSVGLHQSQLIPATACGSQCYARRKSSKRLSVTNQQQTNKQKKKLIFFFISALPPSSTPFPTRPPHSSLHIESNLTSLNTKS